MTYMELLKETNNEKEKLKKWKGARTKINY